MKSVNIYCDGACSGNPGPGGYGVILEYNGSQKELSAGYRYTTNNRMELMAVIKGLNALREPVSVTITTDSRYVVDAINKGWVARWQSNEWRRDKKDFALNVDLWKQLMFLLEIHEVSFRWVKGHNGHPQNERCDCLATYATNNSSEWLDDMSY